MAKARKTRTARRAAQVVPPKIHRKPAEKCVVCGDPVAPFSIEELCWVCRRLKISAWRESDNQMSAPE